MKKGAGLRELRPPTVVSIASSDSGGGAGIQADLLTFAAHGVHGATVIVAGTAQNTRGVRAVEPFPARFVAAQIDAVFEDLRPRAVKIGMLFDAARVRTVARGLDRHRARNVVLDPVMVSTSGARLLSRSGVDVLRRELLPRCDLVTPNRPEAEALARMRIRSDSDRRLAAGVLADLGARAVLLKGGHGRGAVSRDLLFDGRFFTEFSAPRLRTRATHGTGCVLSAAIASELALGRGLEDAILRAIAYLRAGLSRGRYPGRGPGIPDRFPPGYRIP
jgi:hydroxymethylpyrimidine/phosphomethylpyrimidine kinase